MRKFTAAGREEIRRREAKKEKVPQVGLFFVVNGTPCVEGIPWIEHRSLAGIRTYGVDHPDYWRRLQVVGAVPKDMRYDDAPRGRVDYEDASRRFSLFADRCIIRNKRLVSAIMNKLDLPRDTRVLADDHYRCPRCLGKASDKASRKPQPPNVGQKKSPNAVVNRLPAGGPKS
jgi:hypothetical protein